MLYLDESEQYCIDTIDGSVEPISSSNNNLITTLHILSQQDLYKVLRYLSSFALNMSDIGGEDFEDTIAYVSERGTNRLGGSHYDYANSMKNAYKDAIGVCPNLDADLDRVNDLLIEDYLQNVRCRDFYSNKTIFKTNFNSKWHLSKDNLYILF